MSGQQLSQSENALLEVIVSFGKLLSELAEAHLTITNRVVFWLCESENFNFLALRYLKTSTSPFEEWAEQWLNDGEVQSSSTKEMACGEGLI
jgi:hypothetical protein